MAALPTAPTPAPASAPTNQAGPTTLVTGPTIASALNEPSNDPNVEAHLQAAITNLGTLVESASERFLNSTSWEAFVKSERGPPHLQSDLHLLPHPAGALLKSYHDHGVPALFDDDPWTPARLEAAMRRGCHPLAHHHRAFIADEMVEMSQDGFWTVLPYELVKDLPGLRLSPAHIKEERDRRPRFLADHTFYGMNAHTLDFAPKDAMQFGGTLYRHCYHIRHADPQYGPVMQSKYDVKDGFYKLDVRPNHAPGLAVVLPTYEGLPQLVAIPLCLTMGWINSPPTFCGLSETVCDLANDRLYRRHSPPHRLEGEATVTDESPPLLKKGAPTSSE